MRTIKNIFILKTALLFVLLFPVIALSQSNILSGNVTNGKGKKIIFSRVYGKETFSMDSVVINDNGTFRFIFPDSLYTGLFKLSVNKNEFNIIYHHENIAVEVNPSQHEKIKILSSEENKAFYTFLDHSSALDDSINYLTLIGKKLFEISPDKNRNDLKKIAKQIGDIETAKIKFADSLTSKHPDLFASKMIKASLMPDFKTYMKKKDAATYPSEAEFLREHFFDNIDFADSNLLHTDIIFNKIGEYFQYFADPPSVDAFKKAIDFILIRAVANKNVYNYVMNTMLKTFDHSSWEEVYSYVADKYISQNSCTDDSKIKKLSAKSNAIKALRIGNKSPEIRSTDLNGKVVILDSVKSPYTLVLFWASWCDFCEKAMPDIKNIYAKYKMKGLEIFAVSLDSVKQNWILATNKYAIPWINTCDLKGFRSRVIVDYNIYSTPTFFLLDADKKIIARPVNTAILKEELEKLKWNN